MSLSSSASPLTANTPKSGGEPNVKTFRFEFGKEFIGELSRFSKVHQFDERRTYKEEWQKWKMTPAIDEVITKEIRRLEESGYKGDIEDKMFKSGRYYFRKKVISNNNNIIDNNIIDNNTIINNIVNDSASSKLTPISTPTLAEIINENPSDNSDSVASSPPAATADTATSDEITTKKKQTQRRPYITMSKSCIRMMDAHIKSHSTNDDFKPSTSYDLFYQEKMSTPEMMTEIEVIIEKFEKTIQQSAAELMSSTIENANVVPSLESIMLEIMDKIKKTYKNRYYRFVNK
jgi:hypothetical protein